MLGEELPSLPPLTVRHWFFIIQIFEQLSCSEKQSCPETFHCVEIFFIFHDFWATCGLPWKTECALNSLYWIYIFLIIQNFEELAHALKNRGSLKFFTALKYFYLSGFLRSLRLPWKQSLSWNFSLYLVYFLRSGCLSNCCLPWKTECALNSLYWMYFYPSEFWTCAFPEKQSLPCKFSLHWNIFYLSGFLSNLSLPWKQSLPWIFQAGGATAPPPRTPLTTSNYFAHGPISRTNT